MELKGVMNQAFGFCFSLLIVLNGIERKVDRDTVAPAGTF